MLVSECSLGSNLSSTLGQEKFRPSRSTFGFLSSLKLMTFCNFFNVQVLLNIDFLCLIYAAFKSQRLVCGVRSENFCTLIYRKRCPITCKDGTFGLEWERQRYSSSYTFTRCCNGMVCQHHRFICHAQTILQTGKRPQTYYARGCVGFGACLDGFGPSSPLQNTIPTMQAQPPICYYYNVSIQA